MPKNPNVNQRNVFLVATLFMLDFHICIAVPLVIAIYFWNAVQWIVEHIKRKDA